MNRTKIKERYFLLYLGQILIIFPFIMMIGCTDQNIIEIPNPAGEMQITENNSILEMEKEISRVETSLPDEELSSITNPIQEYSANQSISTDHEKHDDINETFFINPGRCEKDSDIIYRSALNGQFQGGYEHVKGKKLDIYYSCDIEIVRIDPELRKIYLEIKDNYGVDFAKENLNYPKPFNPAELEEAFEEVKEFLGEESYQARMEVFIIPDKVQISRDYSTTGAAGLGRLIISADNLRAAHHELVHLVSYRWNKQGAPSFFGEGLAVYTDTQLRNLYEPQVLCRVTDEMISTIYLAYIPGGYPTAGSFVGFLVENYGIEKFKKFYAGSMRTQHHETTKNTFNQLYGITFEEAIVRWELENKNLKWENCTIAN